MSVQATNTKRIHAGADLRRAVMAGCDLARALFHGAQTRQADLAGANLTGVRGLTVDDDVQVGVAAGGDDPDPAPPGLAGPEGDVGGQDEEGGQRAQGVEGGDPPLGPRLHICSHGAYYSVASAPRPVRGVPAASPGAHDDEEPHP